MINSITIVSEKWHKIEKISYICGQTRQPFAPIACLIIGGSPVLAHFKVYTICQ